VVADDRVVLGTVQDDELSAFLAAFDLTFGITRPEGAVERVRGHLEVDRLVAARDDGRIVATAGAYSFELSVPGGDPAPCAGVTLVSVRADHRRRGVLRAMMTELLDDAADRGEPFAALWASEGPIYGRFGFGPAVPTASFELDRRQARFRVHGPVSDVELVDADEAASRYPAIYDAARADRPVLFGRSQAWWRRELDDPPEAREGAGEKRFAVLADRAYAIHRLRPSWDEGLPTGTVEIHDLVATDAEAAAAMWRFVVETDLSARLTAGRRPVDDPLPLLLDDPVAPKPRAGWPLYVRLVDVPRALSARRYGADGELTFELHDAFRPSNAGRWRLRVADGLATCEPTTATAELELDVEDLATVALGGVRVSSVVGAGRIDVLASEAVARADRLFATEVAPWHGFMF
jgi:predicted acetyltransferase